MECGILRAHIVNLENMLADAQAAHNRLVEALAKCQDERDAARTELESAVSALVAQRNEESDCARRAEAQVKLQVAEIVGLNGYADKLERDLATLREREEKLRVMVQARDAECDDLCEHHAEAVEQAFREGHRTERDYYAREEYEDAAWLASDAHARLKGGGA